jgi:hypothetical protein
LTCLFGCQNQANRNDDNIIEINLTEALKNKKDFPLSNLVKDVEILELESKADCYIQYPILWHLGKNHILIFDLEQTQVLLFNRQGKFIRKIGKSGKGPGEYHGTQLKGDMSKDEKFIIISDSRGRNVIVYNLDGKVMVQKDISNNFSSKYFRDMKCHFDNLISFVPQRPWEQTEGFSSVVLFDMNLDKTGEVLNRENDENLLANIQYALSFENKDGVYFWEVYNDTVYQYFKNGESKPKFRFTVDKNQLTKEAMDNWSLEINQNFTFPVEVYFIPGYLVAYIWGDTQNVLFDLKSKEAFSINKRINCFIESERSKPYNCIQNDVFGFEPPH